MTEFQPGDLVDVPFGGPPIERRRGTVSHKVANTELYVVRVDGYHRGGLAFHENHIRKVEVTTEDPSSQEWGRIMAAQAHGNEDVVNAPSHYQQLPVECIDVAEHFGYLLGNCVKYIWRHQYKGKPLEDLRKARYYLDRAIQKLEASQ